MKLVKIFTRQSNTVFVNLDQVCTITRSDRDDAAVMVLANNRQIDVNLEQSTALVDQLVGLGYTFAELSTGAVPSS